MMSVHNSLTIGGFWNMFGEPEVSCPGAFNLGWMGRHRGIASDEEFERNFLGTGVIMLRQPEQRIISAYRDTQHSWPYPYHKARNLREFAEGMQGCCQAC